MTIPMWKSKTVTSLKILLTVWEFTALPQSVISISAIPGIMAKRRGWKTALAEGIYGLRGSPIQE